jgi:hypothetical protein
MSGTTKKISQKAKMKENEIKLQMLFMYFKEYALMPHYLRWVQAAAEGTELPPKIKQIDE